VGKEALARFIHAHSTRVARPFLAINCAAVPEALLESELFGHRRGAFTGASQDRVGLFEAANGGTLLLDEIGETPLPMQAKLLRVLQEREVRPVGDVRSRRIDVRILAATNRDLGAEVAAGRFREDLLYRLDVVAVTVPPLRERTEDILPLARRFLAFFARGREPKELSPAAERALVSYSWPGNVRELRNALERAVILSPGRVLEPECLPERIAARASDQATLGGDSTVDEIEREHILRVLARVPTAEEAARILGIDTSTLWRKRKKYGR
jgi:NtrC-family two-component system response regulator AlgB